jgi:hypothetical protein
MSRSAPLGPYGSFDPHTLSFLQEIFETAWHDICCSNTTLSAVRADLLRERLAATIMKLAHEGERSSEVLRRRAILSLKALEHLN